MKGIIRAGEGVNAVVTALRAILQHPRVLVWGPWLLIAVGLARLHAATWSAQWDRSMDPLAFNDDVTQQVFPFFRFQDPELFTDDFHAQYYMACFPVGFRVLYMASGYLGDPVTLSKVLPHLLCLVTVVAAVVAAARLGGKWSAFVTGSLILGCQVYMGRMGGGLPRSFAFPLLAVGFATLAAGRMRWLAVLVPLASAFYPMASIPLGLSLAGVCLLLRDVDRGNVAGWSQARRIRLVALSAFATVLVVATPAVGSGQYGEAITVEMADEYPEIGPSGRYGSDHRAPFAGFFEAAPRVLKDAVTMSGKPVLEDAREWLDEDQVGERLSARRVALHDLLVVLTLMGTGFLVRRTANGRRVLLLLAGALAGHLVSRFVFPYFYLPFRYVVYPVTLGAAVILPAAIAEFRHIFPAQFRPPYAAVSALVLVGVLGGAGDEEAGLNARLGDKHPVLDAVARLPKDALIAGWPNGPIDNVPYVARRKVLVSYELHQAFHVDHVLEMRQRMRALIDAYFATDLKPLIRLRDEFGVTHLLVRLAHYRKRRPHYFEPFSLEVHRAFKAVSRENSEVLRQIPVAGVFRGGGHVLVNLDRLKPIPTRDQAVPP